MIWVVALPLVMYRFHIFAPIAIVLNAILWLPMLVALFSGFALLVLGWLIPPAGPACASICDMSLWMLESIVQLSRAMEGSHFWVAGPARWWLLSFYGALGLLAAFPRLRPRKKTWCLAAVALWVGVGFSSSWWLHRERQGDAALQCTFLFVGHGTSVVLELPRGETILYDAGTLGAPVAATRSVSSFLWSRGIRHLDAVVLSHADVDHYNALPELLQRFDTGVIYTSPVMFDDDDPALKHLSAAIERAGVSVAEVYAGDCLKNRGSVNIEVLHPPSIGVLGTDNANSIVLKIKYHGRQIILPGDLESLGSLVYSGNFACFVGTVTRNVTS